MRRGRTWIHLLSLALLACFVLMPVGALAAPSAPGNFRVTAIGNDSVTVAWNASTPNPNPLAKYVIEVDGVIKVDNILPATRSQQVTGLTQYTSYQIAVYAVDSGAVQSAKSTITAVPGGSTPIPSLALTPGDRSIAVSWTAPTISNGASLARYEVSLNGTNWTNASNSSARTHTFSNLTNGTAYTVYVRAVVTGPSGTLNGPPKSDTATPIGTPDAPVFTSATPGDGQVALAWTAPANDGGAPITNYEIKHQGEAGWNQTGGALTYTYTGLTNGTTYTFQVRAVNGNGEGLTSTISATPVTIPGPPSNPRTESGNESVTVRWGAPQDTGGSRIKNYWVSADQGATWKSVGGNVYQLQITGLVNGQTYTFWVRAENDVGQGPDAVVDGVPVGSPLAPQNIDAVIGDKQITVTWDPPADDGGSPIVGYAISMDGSGWTNIGDVNSYVFRNLENGTSYTFYISARNAKGRGPAATVQASPTREIIPPSPPQNLQAEPLISAVRLTWDKPKDDGGRPIVTYEVSTDGTMFMQIGTGHDYLFMGLENGQSYTFYVRTRVQERYPGDPVEVVSSTVTVRATPSQYAGTPPAPRNFHIEALGPGWVRVRWQLPGGPIAPHGYLIRLHTSEDWIELGPNVTEYTFEDLPLDTSYVIYIRSFNDIGPGVMVRANANISETGTSEYHTPIEDYTTPRQPGVIVGGPVALMTQPGGGQQIGTLVDGQPCGVIGSNAAGTWVRITVDDDNKAGWVPAGTVAEPVDDGHGLYSDAD